MAKIFKRCACPEDQWDSCPHQWVVRYRTTGGRSSRQREQSFGTDLREAEDFALKVEHDKRAHVFVDPKAGRALFRDEAETWLNQHLGADSSITTYRSVLRAHVYPAIGGKPIGAIRREDIKALIAAMRRKGLTRQPDRLRAPGHQRGAQRGRPGQEARRVALHRHPAARRRHRRRLHPARPRAGARRSRPGCPPTGPPPSG